MESDDVFEYVSNQDFSEAGPLDVEASEIPDFPAPQPMEIARVSTSDLIAIYKLQKAGFVPSDFE